MDDLSVAKSILQAEIDGIANVMNSLGDSFVRVVDEIDKTTGKVVLSGIGKSGHIAKKIAATFSSIGVHSVFLHPSEASHGDLGIISQNDTVILISNSGDTKEIRDICLFTKENKIKSIAIVGNIESFLGQNCDIILCLNIKSEAINSIPAPTVSTTVTLSIGDAIAGCIVERRGFARNEYNKLHPGGKLGRLMLKIKDVMRPVEAVPLVKTGAKMREAVLEMSSKGLGLVGVLDVDNKLIGVISDGDIRRHINGISLTQSVDEVMTHNPKVFDDSIFVIEAIEFMQNNKLLTIFITDDNNKPIGIVQLYDILRL